MVNRCLEGAKPYAGRVIVLDLRTIIPWDQESVLDCVRQTGKVLVVHEDTRTAGFAGEIIATIASHAFSDLDAPIKRLATPDIPIPYNIDLMDSILPGKENIQTQIKALLNY
jgi:2-oxoisovalerate dehydrogenase E1 component